MKKVRCSFAFKCAALAAPLHACIHRVWALACVFESVWLSQHCYATGLAWVTGASVGQLALKLPRICLGSQMGCRLKPSAAWAAHVVPSQMQPAGGLTSLWPAGDHASDACKSTCAHFTAAEL